ncbi:MAG: hypothetical protein V1863_06805 [Candidatus Omnitrophota bacterium]
MKVNRGIALVNMLFFAIIFSIIAAAMLSLIASTTLHMEHDIRRAKAFYVADAQLCFATDHLRRTMTPYCNGFCLAQIPWGIDLSGAVKSTKGATIDHFVHITPFAVYNPVDIRAIVDYSRN